MTEESRPITAEEDAELRRILQDAKVIAVVGYSDKPYRDSYRIGKFLKDVGYTVYPVNPAIEEVNGDRSYPSLADVPEPIDIVDVFRRSEHLEAIVEEAIEVGARVVWAQLGIVNEAAARKATGAGLKMVMDHCIKIEYNRLMRG